MRLIGHLSNEPSAGRFSDFLCVEGIANQVEADGDGWAVWIHSEDQLDRARDLLAEYRRDPEQSRFQNHGRRARELREQEEKEEAKAAKRLFDRSRVFRSVNGYRAGPLTLLLILGSVALSLWASLGDNVNVTHWFQIAEPNRRGELTEVMAGQVWRLITPIFLHFGVLHLLFNLLWLYDLGGMVEGRQGSGRLAVLVTAIGVGSNVAQFFVNGPNFGGMSGVVYGLLGYIWMRGKNDPGSGLFLHPQTVLMMLVWFFICLTPWIPGVANTVHAVGLIMGMAWGYFSALQATRRR
jgi:GlpG protein